MDVDFMFTDSIEAVRPKLVPLKTFEAAALAVDEMFNTAFQNAGREFELHVFPGT